MAIQKRIMTNPAPFIGYLKLYTDGLNILIERIEDTRKCVEKALSHLEHFRQSIY